MTKELPELIIDSTLMQKEYLKDLLRYRELFYFLAWRDILVRYKQAFFGVGWAIVRPLLNMIAFAFLFGRVANLPSENIHYGLFVLAGMLPWQLFANSVQDTCQSLVNNSHLVSKIYFPRLIIPVSQIIVHLLDFGIGLIFLLLFGLCLGQLNWLTMLSLPLFIALTIFLCIGASLWLSALTAKYRDIRIIVPFVLQFGMFVSPVGYGSFLIPDKWQWIYALNPVVGIIDAFRWALFGVSYPGLIYSLICSIIITSVLVWSGLSYFRKVERSFADTI